MKTHTYTLTHSFGRYSGLDQETEWAMLLGERQMGRVEKILMKQCEGFSVSVLCAISHSSVAA